MRVIDPGHLYQLAERDGVSGANSLPALRFVKRVGDRYPGNKPPAYPGTTIQEVIRALIDRAEYVNRQIPCAETEAAIGALKIALLLFEVRASRVDGRMLDAARIDDVVHGAC